MAEHGWTIGRLSVDATRAAVELMLYIAIVLLTLIVSFGDDLTEGEQLALIWGTAAGLTLAHVYAVAMADLFAEGGNLSDNLIGIGVTVVSGTFVAVLASLPYWIANSLTVASSVSQALLVGLLGVAGYLTGRHRGLPVQRSLLFAAAAVVLAAVVVVIKYQLTH